MRIKKVWLICVLAVFAALLAVLLYPKNVVGAPEDHKDADLNFTVVLNEYAPADWNQGYGHYDLSIGSHAGFTCMLNGEQLECKTITLSYGPIDGDESPARVNLYTQERSDHKPSDRIVVYDALSLKDFDAFMRWFTRRFSDYERENWDYHVFLVKANDFREYSVAGKKNCVTGALRMLEAMPGIEDTDRNGCADVMEKLEARFQEKGFM